MVIKPLLTFGRATRLWVFAVALCIGCRIWGDISLLWILVPSAAYLILLIDGSVRVNSGFYLPAVCHGPGEVNQIALSFDDGPDPAGTPAILDILEKYQVKAAFFCIGKNVAAHPEMARRMIREGHLVGNHSYSHAPWFDLWGVRRVVRDLQGGGDILKTATGRLPLLFRPPYGVTNPPLARAVAQCGLTCIGWSLRSLDTVQPDPQKLLEKIISQLHPGAVLLFHDRCISTQRLLARLLEHLAQTGWRVERLDKMLNLTPYA